MSKYGIASGHWNAESFLSYSPVVNLSSLWKLREVEPSMFKKDFIFSNRFKLAQTCFVYFIYKSFIIKTNHTFQGQKWDPSMISNCCVKTYLFSFIVTINLYIPISVEHLSFDVIDRVPHLYNLLHDATYYKRIILAPTGDILVWDIAFLITHWSFDMSA